VAAAIAIPFIVAGSCFLASLLGVGVMRHFALARGIVDVPNARSSHEQPVPRGGGLVIALVASAALFALGLSGALPWPLAFALLVPGAVVACIGYLDDLGGVPALRRLCVQAIAAAAALAILGGWDAGLPRESAAWWILQAALVVGITWATNLYNFMDGIDGIAGAEAVFLGVGGAVMLQVAGQTPGTVLACLVLGAASLGFLAWNWPPARIFMGDVGSGYLGLVYAVVALATSREDPSLLAGWLILSGTFVADSGATLGRRLARRERFYEAHRIHAYQWLARRLGGHLPVTLLYSAVNLLWLLPMAWLSVRFAAHASWIAALALAPLVAAALAAGAGRTEPGARA
jgi:Fuc2NAc and GlcNAc transferase